MPNWCFTDYVVEGNEKEVSTLRKALIELDNAEKPLVENGFGNTWLGCLVKYFGGDWEKIGCRGQYLGKRYSGEGVFDVTPLAFSTETAWAPCDEVFEFIKSKLPSLKFYWSSEESGMGEFWTNDKERKYFSKYAVEYDYNDEYDTKYFNNFDEIYEEWEEDDNYIYLREFRTDENDKLL